MALSTHKWITTLILMASLTSCDSGKKEVTQPGKAQQTVAPVLQTSIKEESFKAVIVDVPVEDEMRFAPKPEPAEAISAQGDSKQSHSEDASQRNQTEGVAGLSCQTLWKARNQVFHDRGYCYKGEAKNVFDNAGCQYDKASNVPLSVSEKEYVKSIRAIEEYKGCIKNPNASQSSSFFRTN
jgi:hypothetical protein